MGQFSLRRIVLALLLQWAAPLTPRRHHRRGLAVSKTSLSVAVTPPPPTDVKTTTASISSTSSSLTQRSINRKTKKEEHEYRWLTWVYENSKDVPPGKLDPEIVKQFAPALSAYGRRGTVESAQQAEELLDRYIQEYRAGNQVVALENTAFHAVMDAYSKCAEPDKAQQVLQRMIDLCKSEPAHFAHLTPDVFSFTILATAWARSRHPGAADKAERLLHHMESKDMKPRTLTYNVVLKAIAVSHDPHKAARAAAIVRKMQKLVAAGQVQCEPDLYTYQTWIHACSRTRGGVPQTMEILKYLDEQSAAGNQALRPNAYCFAAAIHAWAYSSEPNKSKRAYELLQDMRQRYEIYGQKSCKPNVVVFTSVINACVKPPTFEDKEMAYQIAQLVFEELIHSAYGNPNFLTYAAFIHVCATTLDDFNQRESAVRWIFGLCKQHGCVGKIVLQKLEEAVSEDVFDMLMGPYESWEDMPRSWKRRVKGERFRPQLEVTTRNAATRGIEKKDSSSAIHNSVRFVNSAPKTIVPSTTLSDVDWEMQFL